LPPQERPDSALYSGVQNDWSLTRENGHEPASKQDVVDAIKASEDRVIETMRDIQTEILKALYSFAESNRQRLA
jgi:hypothetical protein